MNLASSQLIKIIGLGFLLVALPVVIFLVNQQQIFRGRAAASPVNFLLVPPTATKQLNETFTVSVRLDTKTYNVSGVDMTLSFDKNILELQSFQPATSTLADVLVNQPNNTTGTLRLLATKSTSNAATGVLDIGTLTFRGKALGTSSVLFQNPLVTASGQDQYIPTVGNTTGQYTIVAVTASPVASPAASRVPCTTAPVCSGQCTAPSNTCSTNNGTKNSCVYTGPVTNCLQVAAPNQPCTLSNCSAGNVCNSSGQCATQGGTVSPVNFILQPQAATKQLNEAFTVAVKLDSKSYNVSGVDMTLSFDKNILELQSFQPTASTLSDVLVNEPNNATGTLRLLATKSLSNNATGVLDIGTLNFRGKALGTSSVVFQNPFVTASGQDDYIPTVGNTTGQYTIAAISASPSPSAGCPAGQPFCPRTGTCLAPNICNPASPTVSVAPSIVPSPQGGTRCYKIAEDLATLNNIPDEECLPYESHPLITNFTFADPSPGRKFVFVRYYSNSGQTSDATAFIDLIADPEISGCSIEFKGNTVGFVVVGNNFGTVKGKIQVGNVSPVNFQEWSNSRLVATIPTNQFKDPGLQTVPVFVTRSDGLVAKGACSNKANSNLSLGAKLFCPQVSAHTIENVELKIVEASKSGQIVYNQKVTIDDQGVIIPKVSPLPLLKENFGYRLSIKVPKGVRQVLEFIGQLGTTNVTDFTVHGKRLALGDIAPQDGDGIINSFDKGELNTEWNLTEEDFSRPGDLNFDGRVNSFDWACMRYDFGKSDAPDPTPGPLRTLRLPTPMPSVIFNSVDQNI